MLCSPNIQSFPPNLKVAPRSLTALQFSSVLRIVRLLCTINLRALSTTFSHVEIRASSIIIVGFTVYEYMGQYDHAAILPGQHPHQQMLPPPLQTQQQLQQRTTTTTPVSNALGYAAKVLRNRPSPTQPSDYCCIIK